MINNELTQTEVDEACDRFIAFAAHGGDLCEQTAACLIMTTPLSTYLAPLINEDGWLDESKIDEALRYAGSGVTALGQVVKSLLRSKQTVALRDLWNLDENNRRALLGCLTVGLEVVR